MAGRKGDGGPRASEGASGPNLLLPLVSLSRL